MQPHNPLSNVQLRKKRERDIKMRRAVSGAGQRAAGKHHWSQATWLWRSERLSSDSSKPSGQITRNKEPDLSSSVPSRWQTFSCHSNCTVAGSWDVFSHNYSLFSEKSVLSKCIWNYNTQKKKNPACKNISHFVNQVKEIFVLKSQWACFKY